MRSATHSGSGARVFRSGPRPERPSPWRSTAIWVGAGIVLASALLYATWSILPVLIASAVLGWMLHRPVEWLQARGVSRELGFALILGGALSAVVLLVAVVVPLVVHQISELAVNVVPYLKNLEVLIAPYKAEIEARLGVPIPLDVDELAAVAPEYLKRVAAVPNASEVVGTVLSRVAGGGMQILLTVLTLTLVPLFTFYVCIDWPHIVATVDALVPSRHRPLIRRVMTEIDARSLAFVQGQITLCFILGCIYSFGLWLCDIDLAIVIGMLGGALFVIPYAGTAIGGALAAVLALLKFGADWHVIGAIGTFVGGQLIEGSLLTPRIVGEKVGLHPMVVMVGVVVFGNLLGVWGLVVAVPLTAACSVVAGELLTAWRQSRTYLR